MGQEYFKIINNPEVIDWARQSLKKSNRIVWYLKQVKENSMFHPCPSLVHYYSMNIPEINNYPLKGSLPDVLCIFKELEIAYLKSLKEETSLIPYNKKDVIFIKLADDYAWVDLNKPYCKKEAKAMGHCGNENGNDEDTILSLRKKVIKGGKTFWEPHLTFILEEDGCLGEMKGKQNNRPQEKYHPQIWELITHPKILGMRGEGYLPENNFHLQQMSAGRVSQYLKDYSYKFEKKLYELIQNRNNLSFFKKELVCNIQIVPWIVDEKILVYLALNASYAVQKEAIVRVKEPQNIFKLMEKADPAVLGTFCTYLKKESLNEKTLLKIWDISVKRGIRELQNFVSENISSKEIAQRILKSSRNFQNPKVNHTSRVLALRFLDRNLEMKDLYLALKESFSYFDKAFSDKSEFLLFKISKGQEAIAIFGTNKEKEVLLNKLKDLTVVQKIIQNDLVSPDFKKLVINFFMNPERFKEVSAYLRKSSRNPREYHALKSKHIRLFNEILNLPLVKKIVSEEAQAQLGQKIEEFSAVKRRI